MSDTSELVTANEAAEILGVTRMRINQLIKANKLEAMRMGNMWLISKDSIQKRLANPPKNSKINKESPWRDR